MNLPQTFPKGIYRPALAVIDLDAPGFNHRQIPGELSRGIKFFAIAKPSAYGHGASPIIRGLTLSIFLLLFALTGLACLSTQGKNIDLGPLYYRRDVPLSGGKEGALLWPFFQWESSPSVRQFGFRPLFNIRWEKMTGSNTMKEIQALWPLFLYRNKPNEFRTRLFPIFHYTDYHHPNRTEDVDWAVLPVLFGGRSHQEGAYFALFPLGGMIKGILGKDRIRFFMFPLYSDSVDGEHRSWNILWPIFQYAQGGGRTSYRIWPLLGRKWKKEFYQKEFLFWPLITHMRDRQGLEHPIESWFFLPFYGRQETPFGCIYYWLFPFFSYQRNERPGNRFREWAAPWPVFALAKGDKYNKMYFWPFWGRSVIGDFETRFTLYPIYWFFTEKTKTFSITRHWLLPFYWSRDQSAPPEEGGRQRMVKLWPFLDYESTDEMGRVRFLSPLWFRDPEGFERNYSVFWEWYDREEYREKEVSLRVLWIHDYKIYKNIPYDEKKSTGPSSGGTGPELLGPLKPPGEPKERVQEHFSKQGDNEPLGRALLKGIIPW